MGITLYATGCKHYGLAAMNVAKDGNVKNWEWFDESRLVFVKKFDIKKSERSTSGPDMNPRCK
jgi:hypothetical protein